MKSKFAGIHCLDGVAAAITKQMLHDFNLKRQEMTNLKRKVSYAEIMEKLDYLRILTYYDGSGV
jgi:hypothetical protein